MKQKSNQSRPWAALKGARSMWSALMLLVMMLTATTAMAQTEDQVISLTRDGQVTYFASFEDAVDDGISSGDTLTLLADATISNSIYFDECSFTIDLNGYTLDGKYTDYKEVWSETESDWVIDTDNPYENYRTLSLQGNITIKNGTLKANIDNYSVGFDYTLTLEKATLYGRTFQWMANGAVTLRGSVISITNEEGYGSFSFESIAIDEESKVSLTGVSGIGCYGNVPGGYKELVHRITLPEGYMFKQMYSDQNLTVVKKSEPDYAADMTGITIEADGAAAPGDCRDFKYIACNKHNDDYTNYWTDYDYCCILCFEPEVTRSIRWDDDLEGYNCINFVLTDDEEYYDLLNNVVYDPNFSFHADQASYTRKTISKFGTLVIPFEVAYDSIMPYDLYTIASIANDSISLNRVDYNLAAGLPVLVKLRETAKEADTEGYSLSLTNSDVVVMPDFYATEDVDGMTLTGTYNVSEITEGYILNDDVFAKIDSLKANDELWDDDNSEEAKAERTLFNPPFRAYLTGTMPTNPNKLAIDWGEDDRFTAVEAVKAVTSEDAQYYDINGRRIPELQKGVNIVKRGDKTYKVIVR